MLQQRGTVWVKKGKWKSHFDSFESPCLRDRAVPVSMLQLIECSEPQRVSEHEMTNISQLPQRSLDFYQQKGSCRKNSIACYDHACHAAPLPSAAADGWVAVLEKP